MYRPHFLEEPPFRSGVSVVLFIVLSLCAAAWSVLYSVMPAAAALVLVLGLVLFFLPRRVYGIFAMSGFAFFHGLEVVFEQYPWARGIPYLASINAPLVDFVALFFFLVTCLALVLRVDSLSPKHLYRLFPKALWYVLFLLVALWSALHAYDGLGMVSLKYLFRPMIFVYAMYVLLPLVLLQKRMHVERVMYILTWIGIAIALFGMVGFGMSLLQSAWPRVQPFGFLGIAPLGYNHNMIAEVLIALFPIPFFVGRMAASPAVKRLYYIFGSSMIVVALLTVSRAAWVAFAAQLFLVGWIYRDTVRHVFKQILSAWLLPVTVGVIALVGYMSFFLGSSIVSSSNEARIYTTDIVLFYVARQPLFGYGPGMFQFILNDTAMYTLEFGDALDAHGIVLKLLLETGVVGVLLFWVYMGSIGKAVYQHARQTRDPLLIAVFVSATGALVFQLFNTSYFNSHMWFPIGLALATYQLSRYGDSYALSIEKT